MEAIFEIIKFLFDFLKLIKNHFFHTGENVRSYPWKILENIQNFRNFSNLVYPKSLRIEEILARPNQKVSNFKLEIKTQNLKIEIN